MRPEEPVTSSFFMDEGGRVGLRLKSFARFMGATLVETPLQAVQARFVAARLRPSLIGLVAERGMGNGENK